MSKESVPVTINILDREYRIACPEEEKSALLDSARYLGSKMQEVRDGGRIVGIDRIAVMAALNIVHELLQYKAQLDEVDRAIAPQFLALQARIDAVLDRSRQIEI